MPLKERKAISIRNKEDHAMRTANLMITTATELKDLLAWAIKEEYPLYIEDLVDDNTIKRTGEKIGEIKAPFYNIDIHGTKDWDRVSGEISIEYTTSDKLIVYFDKSKQGIMLFPVILFGYEYPPKTIRSMLFFLLNPNIEKKILKMAGKLGVSDEFLEAVQDWFMLKDKTRNISAEIDIDLDDLFDRTYGAIVLGNYPKTGSFEHIEAFMWSTDSEDRIAYHVKFNIENKELVYTLIYSNQVNSLSKLLVFLLKEKEIETLYREFSKIRSKIRGSYLIARITKKLK